MHVVQLIVSAYLQWYVDEQPCSQPKARGGAWPAAFRQELGLLKAAAGGAQQMHGHTSGKQHCISSLSCVTCVHGKRI